MATPSLADLDDDPTPHGFECGCRRCFEEELFSPYHAPAGENEFPPEAD